MPALTKPRHEAFCRAIVAHIAGKAYSSQGAAYVAAGYNAKGVGEDGGSAEAAASRLLNKVKGISERITELQEQAARKKKITVEAIVEEYEEARAVAKDNAQSSGMVAATAGKAKILGLVVDRSEQGKPGDFSQAESTVQIANMLLMQAGLDASEIGESVRVQALDALAHFQDRLRAIVNGEHDVGQAN